MEKVYLDSNNTKEFIQATFDDVNRKVNLENKELYEFYEKRHVDDGGRFPREYAMTELVNHAILTKNYKVYHGGGYEHRSENRIKNYDVVVCFTFANDPYFMICFDNSEGDSCVLYRCNDKCKIETKTI